MRKFLVCFKVDGNKIKAVNHEGAGLLMLKIISSIQIKVAEYQNILKITGFYYAYSI